jgi:prolyl-tRNA editing enzyme YbaK/EbsC (Cys-tRNA(Pro) deacylase)
MTENLGMCVATGPAPVPVNQRSTGTNQPSEAAVAGRPDGGVTAFGISDLPIYVDAAVMEQAHVVMGGGNRSSKLLLNPNELTKLPNVVVVEDLAKPK